jgi:hypothetical protein
LSSLGFKQETGLLVYVDILVLPEYDKNIKMQIALCKSIKKLLTSSLERELKRFSEYRDIIIQPSVDENTGGAVIRCGISFGRHASVDYLFSSSGLPYSLHDIFKNMNGDLFSNVDFIDILTASSISFDELFAMKVMHTQF